MKRLVLTTAAIAVATAAAPAQAAHFVVTIAGENASGVDGTGNVLPPTGGVFFGQPLTNFSNVPYLAVIEFDTDGGVVTTATANSFTFQGGALYGTPSIIREAYLILNGVRVDFSGDYAATARLWNDGMDQFFSFNVDELRFSEVGNGHLSIGGAVEGLSPLMTFDEGFSYSPTNQYGTGGNFRDIRYVSPTDVTTYAYGFMSQGDVVVTAVPEPATWAMLLLGFGGLGFSMRRRSTVAVRTAIA